MNSFATAAVTDRSIEMLLTDAAAAQQPPQIPQRTPGQVPERVPRMGLHRAFAQGRRMVAALLARVGSGR
jgi:hypothetical protein